MIGIGGALLGKAASEILKRFVNSGAGDAEIRKARVELSLLEAQGTIEQRNWRPYSAMLLIRLVAVYMIMPIAAELLNLVATAVGWDIPKFPWQTIWTTTGLALITLATSFLGIYAGGRTWEKKHGVSSGGIGGKLTELITGNSRKRTSRPVKRTTKIKPISEIQSATTAPLPKLNYAVLGQEIAAEEGKVLAIYIDSQGNRTAGYGHLLIPDDAEYDQPVGTVVSNQRVKEWFTHDLKQAVRNARAVVPKYDHLPHEVRLVLANMAFQLGRRGLANFKATLAHITAGEWRKAADESLNSKWANQTPARANRMAARLRAVEPDVYLS